MICTQKKEDRLTGGDIDNDKACKLFVENPPCRLEFAKIYTEIDIIQCHHVKFLDNIARIIQTVFYLFNN